MYSTQSTLRIFLGLAITMNLCAQGADLRTTPGKVPDAPDDPGVTRRNLLRGPGTLGVNAGIRKVFRFGERIAAELGADINNLFNHPLLSPDVNDTSFYNVGSFSLKVNPATRRTEIDTVVRNPNFGRLINSYAQENIDTRRAIRLRLRIRF